MKDLIDELKKQFPGQGPDQILDAVKKGLAADPLSCPEALEKPDFTALTGMVKDYAAYVFSDEFHEDNDWDVYIFEAAIEAVYGDDFWKAFNKRVR